MMESLILDSKERLNLVNDTLRKIGRTEFDIVLMCSSGETVFSNKKFLGFFSSLVRELCSDQHRSDIVTILIPFSRRTVDLLLEFLTRGEVFTNDKQQVQSLHSLLRCLNIATEDAEILEPAEIDFDDVEIEIDDFEDEKENKKVLEKAPDQNFTVENTLRKENNFKNREHFKNHWKNHSEVEQKFTCEICGRRFGNRGYLYNHMGAHNTINCNLCNMKFSQEVALKCHKKVSHSSFSVSMK